ncbi:betaine/proline/choline family ABC transporter ATP-binding protein [Anaerobacillus sp. MEB173]|uniref:betaine/proline/choline family ABC transporter ATP-binding protein n=1 Tax=Anaerobacillus sp. MEB173 TaxID=3383345 RepID=UPI003F9093C7
MIKFDKVGKVYDDFTALEEISFEVAKGELIALIGPSGCGKTTSLRMINRLIEPSSGTIYIDGEDISKKDPVELRRNIGYVIQQIGLLPHLTIGKNIGLVPKLKGWKEKEYSNRVDELLDMVGLDPRIYRDRYPSELSGGQQQRVGVIRALAAEPPVVLMDEPFSALDPISREQLQDELVRLQKEIHKTIVFVTHDMDEALKIADRVAVMLNGHIIQLDTPDAIIKNPVNDFVKDFIGEKRLNNQIDEGKQKLTVGNVMNVQSFDIFVDHSVSEALTLLNITGADCLAVTDHNKKLSGIVTKVDLENNASKGDTPIEMLLEKNIPTIDIKDKWENATKILLSSNVTGIPVIQHNEVIGVVTQKSILKNLAILDEVNV